MKNTERPEAKPFTGFNKAVGLTPEQREQLRRIGEIVLATTSNPKLIEAHGRYIIAKILATENTYTTVQECLDSQEAFFRKELPDNATNP